MLLCAKFILGLLFVIVCNVYYRSTVPGGTNAP